MEFKRLATAVASLLLGATVVSAPAAGASTMDAPTVATLPPSHAEASPACAPPGESVRMTISGNIFEPNRDFRLVSSSDGKVLGTGHTRSDGTFETSIQPTLPRGPSGVIVEVPVLESWQAVAVAGVTAPCPTIAVTPNPFDRGSVPTTLTINLLGFPIRQTLTLSVDGHPFATVPSEGADGHATFAQPVRLAPPCGSYVISADVVIRPPQFPHSASTVLKVPCPKLSVDPTNIAKEKLPGTVNVSGSAWAPNTDVLVGLDDGTTGTVTMRSDTKGGLNGKLPVPKRDCGPVQVVGVEQSATGRPSGPMTRAPALASQQASATFTITCSKPPTFAVSPQVVSTAGVVRAVGTQLPANRDVLLVWTDADGNPMPGVTRTRVQSDGSLGIFVLVLPRSETGARHLQVFDSTAPGTPPLVGTSLLVVPGPQEPGKQQLLGRR